MPPTPSANRAFEDELPPILVRIGDGAILPDATVAPAGPVQFVVMNNGERPHDFTLVQRDGEGGRVSSAACSVESIAPGETADLVVELRPGTYVMTSSDIPAPETVAELTVQPAETHDERPQFVDPKAAGQARGDDATAVEPAS